MHMRVRVRVHMLVGCPRWHIRTLAPWLTSVIILHCTFHTAVLLYKRRLELLSQIYVLADFLVLFPLLLMPRSEPFL
jgi:hypothetical protein